MRLTNRTPQRRPPARRRSRAALRCGLLTVALAAGASAWAHGLRLQLQPTAQGLAGTVGYDGGRPAAGQAVELHVAAVAAPVATQSADAQGRFAFVLPAAGSFRVVAHDVAGHRAEALALWAPPAAPGAAGPGAGELAAAVRAEVAPLRADVARLEARIRLSDVVGGLGLIAGLGGAWAWLASRRRADRTTGRR